MSDGIESSAGTPQSGRRSRFRLAWVLWGVPLALVAAIAGVMIYNSIYRSTPEKLEEARQRWQAAAIRNYDMEIRVRGGATGTYQIEVRSGKAVRVTRDGRDLETGDLNDRKPATQEQLDAWAMPGLFQIIQNDLEYDAKQGQPGFARVRYDPHNGRLIHYLRASGRNRIVIDVVSFRVMD